MTDPTDHKQYIIDAWHKPGRKHNVVVDVLNQFRPWDDEDVVVRCVLQELRRANAAVLYSEGENVIVTNVPIERLRLVKEGL